MTDACGAQASASQTSTGFRHIVRMEAVQKYFGPVQALRDINLAIARNDIVGLIGDNGAGKSTLIKTLTGVMAPSAGRIYVRDREVDPGRYCVQAAHAMSIETVYQDRSLAGKQPLWRNFFVGRQITNRFGFIKVKQQKAVAERILLNTIGFRGAGITVDSTVGQLSGGERQGIAIGRAMHFNADLIVLDEPNVALAVKEVRKVLDFVRRIKDSGRACIYIEHNLAHVHAVADRPQGFGYAGVELYQGGVLTAQAMIKAGALKAGDSAMAYGVFSQPSGDKVKKTLPRRWKRPA